MKTSISAVVVALSLSFAAAQEEPNLDQNSNFPPIQYHSDPKGAPRIEVPWTWTQAQDAFSRLGEEPCPSACGRVRCPDSCYKKPVPLAVADFVGRWLLVGKTAPSGGVYAPMGLEGAGVSDIVVAVEHPIVNPFAGGSPVERTEPIILSQVREGLELKEALGNPRGSTFSAGSQPTSMECGLVDHDHLICRINRRTRSYVRPCQDMECATSDAIYADKDDYSFEGYERR